MVVGNTYLNFAFDPYKWIEDGMALAVARGFSMGSVRRLTSADMAKDGKIYNKYGYKPSDNRTAEQQFDINTGLGAFLDPDLLSNVETMYTNVVGSLDLGGDISPSRLKFTDKTTGVFTFSQASKGLIRPVEYYSFKQKEIIKADLIDSFEFKGARIYSYDLNGVNEVVQRRQEGTTAIVNSCKNITLKEDFDSGLYLPYDSDNKIVNECKGNKLRYTSTNRKVFAVRSKKGGGVAPYVDLYIPIGQNWGYDTEQMMIQAMPNILLGRILERAGVKVRIFGFYTQTLSSTDASVKILLLKEYGEPVDLNKITVFLTDVRFFRHYMWEASKGWNHLMTNGSTYGGSDGSTTSMTNFNDSVMPFIRNFVKHNIEIGKFNSKVVDKKLMLFSGLNVSSSETFMSDSSQRRIQDKFQESLDYIQIQLSKTPRKIILEIFKREEDLGKSIVFIKNYVNGLINDVMKETVGSTPDTYEDLKRLQSSKSISEYDYQRRYDIISMIDTPDEYEKTITERIKLLDIVAEIIQ